MLRSIGALLLLLALPMAYVASGGVCRPQPHSDPDGPGLPVAGWYGAKPSSKLFIGWFGPRGLASIVFAIIVFDAGLPGRTTLAVAAAFTVLLSVIAHGITANPLVAAIARGANIRAVTGSEVHHH
jgi:hypothetical protein